MTKKSAENKEEREMKSALEFTKSHTDVFAVFIAEFFGSIRFLISFIIFFSVWIILNLSLGSPFDPFPFPILEMMVSIFAIILSVSVLINQNRQGRIEKIKQQVEFEVNVRAEEEITKILNMLHEVHQKLGLHSEQDQDLEKMKKATDVKDIHKKLGDQPE